MVQLPPTLTVRRINDAMEATSGEWRRPHLGASVIGRPCERQIYYSFRWFLAPTFSGRMLRLFRRGTNEEAIFIADLRAIGVTVSEGPAPGEQWRASAISGHFGGSMDAALLGLPEAPNTWHCGEFKTMNKKAFDDLLKNGVEQSKPEHFAQVQVYMELFGFKRGAHLGVCKDDDRLRLERFPHDGPFAGELLAKARRIIFAKELPSKISTRPDYYICKWCDYYEICQHQEGAPDKNCRTCTNSHPMETTANAGAWKCDGFRKMLPIVDQRTLGENCSRYEAIG